MNGTTRINFTCPFCGLAAAVADIGEKSMVLHVLPVCATFARIDDPAEFLAACNAEFKRKPS